MPVPKLVCRIGDVGCPGRGEEVAAADERIEPKDISESTNDRSRLDDALHMLVVCLLEKHLWEKGELEEKYNRRDGAT